MALLRRVALVDKTGHIDPDMLVAAAAAIDVQVKRDLAQFWPVCATVSTLPNAAVLPPGVWPIFIVSRIDDTTIGFHKTHHGQPYAEVCDGEGWTLAASHEILEMLVDPSGCDLVAAPAIQVSTAGEVSDQDGQFEYLIEICDPCEDPEFAYLVDGCVVSDFCTPQFYQGISGDSGRYTFRGTIDRPRRVRRGGYMSWWHSDPDPQTQGLYRLDWTDPQQKPKIERVGEHLPNASLRESVDSSQRFNPNRAKKGANRRIFAHRHEEAAALRRAAIARARSFLHRA